MYQRSRTNILLSIVKECGIKKFFLIIVSLFIFEIVLSSLLLYSLQHFFNQTPLGTRVSVIDFLFYSALSSFAVIDQTYILNNSAKLILIIQLSINTVLLAISVSFLVSKIQLPHENTVVLSDRAFFLKNEQRFAILAVNTSKNALTNLRFISVIRFFRRHHTPETFFLPYLQFSALLFKLNEFDLDKINPIHYDPNNDGLKVSLVCNTDFAEFSVYKKYHFEEILVVDNSSFMDRPLFETPKIENQEFWLKFNKPLDNVETLHEFLRREGSDTNEETK